MTSTNTNTSNAIELAEDAVTLLRAVGDISCVATRKDLLARATAMLHTATEESRAAHALAKAQADAPADEQA